LANKIKSTKPIILKRLIIWSLIFKNKDKKEEDNIIDFILIVVILLKRDINRLVKIV